MAIDLTKPVIDSSRYRNGKSGAVLPDFIGVDDGLDFPAGTVVRDVDGVLALAEPIDERVYNTEVSRTSNLAAAKAEFVKLRTARADLVAASTVAPIKAAILDGFDAILEMFKYVGRELQE